MRVLMTMIECSLRSVTVLDFDSQSEELEAIDRDVGSQQILIGKNRCSEHNRIFIDGWLNWSCPSVSNNDKSL